MDELDHAMLRELGTGQVLLWGGTDPRVSASELADRLGVDRSTVRLRLRGWEKQGFLLGFTTLPNPTLFDMRVAVAGVRVEDAREKAQVLDDLALVEGIFSAMEHVGEWIGLAFADEGATPTRRRVQLLARLRGVVEVQPPMPHHIPRCELVPTAAQWRVVQALRLEGPRAPLGRLAARARMSQNTFRAHYRKLAQANAMWSVPNLDFTCYRGAVLARLILAYERSRTRAEVLRELRKRIPGIMEHPSPEIPQDGPSLLSAHLQAASMGELEDMALAARGIPGAVDVEILHPRRFRVYGSWIDERVEMAARLASGRA